MYQCNPITIFHQIHKELDCEIGKNAVDISLDLRTKCPYIEATIMEIQRFSSIAPVAIMHAAIANCEYRGYNIPKHTEVRFKPKSVSMETNSKLHPRLRLRGVLPGDSFRHRYIGYKQIVISLEGRCRHINEICAILEVAKIATDENINMK